jgi:hypothetical protein
MPDGRSELYRRLASRCREVAALMTRDDLRARLERIIIELEQQAVQAERARRASHPGTKDPLQE